MKTFTASSPFPPSIKQDQQQEKNVHVKIWRGGGVSFCHVASKLTQFKI